METLLRTLIDQNERLIAAVEGIGLKIELFEHGIRADLAITNSSFNVASIAKSINEISSALDLIGGRSILTEIYEELQDVKSAVELLDSTVQVEAEALKRT